MADGKGTSVGESGQSIEADFRQFVAARSASLQRTAYLLVGDWAHAEDVLQTALTKTYLAWKRLGEIEAVEAYARRVLVTTATSWWRRRWHGERPTEIMPERAAPDRLDEQLERQAMWRHVQALPGPAAGSTGAALLRGPHRGRDGAGARCRRRHGEEPMRRALATLRTRLVEAGIEPASPAHASGQLAARRATGRIARRPRIQTRI